MSDLDKDPMFNTLCDVNDAVEDKIDIKPLVRSIIHGFDSLEGLGTEAVQLYKNDETAGANKVRLMVEFFKMVNNCSEAEEDNLPEDRQQMAATYRAAAAAAETEAAENNG